MFSITEGSKGMDFRITIAPNKGRTKLTVRTQNRNTDDLVTQLARMVEDAVAEFAKKYSA